MTTLDPEDEYLVVINRFDVEPEHAEELLAALCRSTEEYVSTVPFVSANFHMSEDGEHVTNCAQWRTRDDFEAFRANADARRHTAEGASVATSVNPLTYTLRASYGPRGIS